MPDDVQPSAPAQAPQVTFTLPCNEAEVNVILAGLVKLPYEQSYPLIAGIQVIVQRTLAEEKTKQKATLQTAEDIDAAARVARLTIEAEVERIGGRVFPALFDGESVRDQGDEYPFMSWALIGATPMGAVDALVASFKRRTEPVTSVTRPGTLYWREYPRIIHVTAPDNEHPIPGYYALARFVYATATNLIGECHDERAGNSPAQEHRDGPEQGPGEPAQGQTHGGNEEGWSRKAQVVTRAPKRRK